ncbi:hypothetical protein Y032_0002g620 [Ancylostoma ceylanicum]|nr:hypothetical protein Y032_0002g620 [Ancylostoma ceylanicum]
MKCYAQLQSYDFLIFNDSHFVNECRQDRIHFRRHCMVAQALNNYDYVLLVDSDIVVVNPQKRIEEFIDPSADIIFYDRFYNWEVAIGSYIVKNTSWSRQFLLGLAAYYKPFPPMMRRNDNVALMARLGFSLSPLNSRRIRTCFRIYDNIKDYYGIVLHAACVRRTFRTNPNHVKIYPKGTAWVRDVWLTNSLWSREDDFMLHGCKERRRSSYNSTGPKLGIADAGGVWYSPFAGSIDLNRCTPGNTSWNYDENLIAKKEDIDNQLRLYSSEVEKEKAKFVDLLTATVFSKFLHP